MAKLFSAQKQPRLPNYKKRAASKCNTIRVANRYIYTLSDANVRKANGTAEEQKEFVADVKKNLPPTRLTSKMLKENPNLILTMGKEAFSDRRLEQITDTPSSNSSQRSTEERYNQARRRLFRNETSPVSSPDWNESPESANVQEDDFQDFVHDNAFLHFDQDGLVDQLGNANDEILLEEVLFDHIPVQEPPVEEPVIQMVPIENPPLEEQELDVDEVIRINFSISFVNDQYRPDAQQEAQPDARPVAQNDFKPEDDVEEVLDNQINVMEEAMSPPDYRGHVLLNEED